MEKNILNSMFDNLLHIGNKTNFWNTKMKPYIYGSVNGIHVINLLKTLQKLEEIKKELTEISSSGKKILFVGTKIQSRDAFKKIAIETGHFYVTEKWVPGLLTNFKTIRKRILTYLELIKDKENGALEVLTKKEKAMKLLELEKLDKAYSGLKDMKKLPDLVFVSDGVYEKQALKEANRLNIRTLAILNTNGDIDLVGNMIPANTNSVKSFEYLIGELKDSIKPFKKEQKIVVKELKQDKIEKKVVSKKNLNKTEEKTENKQIKKTKELKKETK